MFRSSIFSFDTLHGPFPAPRGLLFAVALLAAVELGVARTDWIWSRAPRSETGVVDALESQIVANAANPRIVLLGDSRTRDAVAPRQLERELRLAEGSVLNLGLTAGTPFDSRTFYERNRDVLRRADVLVVDCEWRYFINPPELTSRVRRYATLQDRIDLLAGGNDLPAGVAGWVWMTYGAGDAIREWVGSLTKDAEAPLPIAPDGRIVWRDEEVETGPQTMNPDSFVRSVFRKSQATQAHAEQLRQLIDLIRADGLRVVLVHWPFRGAFVEACNRDHGPTYQAALDELKQFGAEADEFIFFERGQDAGIPDEYFYDLQHLTPRGAEIMTNILADRLREQTPEGEAPP
jgi:lysophospholipase L1-like esterase